MVTTMDGDSVYLFRVCLDFGGLFFFLVNFKWILHLVEDSLVKSSFVVVIEEL